MDLDSIPSDDEILSWIEEVYSYGIRRPAYDADQKAEQFALEQFRAVGLENVRAEPVELPYWEPEFAFLSVTGDSGSFEVPCFPLPHSSPMDRIDLPLLSYEENTDFSNHAVLMSHPLMRVPPTMLLGESVPEGLGKELLLELHTGGIMVDPGGTLQNSEQVLPFSPLVQFVMEPVIAAGGDAFIGVLEDYPGDSYQYYVPYDGVERPIPGVWIRCSDGRRIQDELSKGSVSISLEVRSKRHMVTSHNIVGELPGADEEWLVIGSHHDGPWSSAVEDASGISLVLAQASYWSKQPAAERPHHLIFLLNAGHMVGGAGCHGFIEQHRSMLDQIVLSIHLEHTANECHEVDGQVVPTGEPETRWFFTTQREELLRSVHNALKSEDLERSLIIPPDVFGDRPTTDGGAFHIEGVPLVNYLTAPFYLFDAMDTLDKIHKPSLSPITRAAIRIIEDTANVSAATMRGR